MASSKVEDVESANGRIEKEEIIDWQEIKKSREFSISKSSLWNYRTVPTYQKNNNWSNICTIFA